MKTAAGFRAEREEAEPKWGKANPRRGIGYNTGGKNYVDYAKQFVREFPVGTLLSTRQFDNWLEMCDLLVIPAESTNKNSDAWLGHLQRRHQHRTKLNKAAAHPRMVDEGSSSFIVVALGGGYEVRAPHIAMSKHEGARRIASLTTTKKRQLGYLMQSADWALLPPYERVMAQEIFYDIEAFDEDTSISAKRIEEKLARLERLLRNAIESGTIKPQNGGLRQLVDLTELGLGSNEDDDSDM